MCNDLLIKLSKHSQLLQSHFLDKKLFGYILRKILKAVSECGLIAVIVVVNKIRSFKIDVFPLCKLVSDRPEHSEWTLILSKYLHFMHKFPRAPMQTVFTRVIHQECGTGAGLSTGPMLADYQTASDSTLLSCPHYTETLQVLSTALTDVQVNI